MTEQTSHALDWPPPYRMRYSKRIKSPRMTLHPVLGLEVVLPARSSLAPIDIINEHRDWILKHEAVIQKSTDLMAIQDQFPSKIMLPAIHQNFKIIYQKRQCPINLKEIGFELYIVGDIHQFTDCVAALKNWLKRKAEYYLSGEIRGLSVQYQLPFNQLKVRFQKTRWGSCSSDRNINLNCCLLFLTSDLVRYVCIHELCHTRYLNHSKAYWALVASVEGDYKQLDSRLKSMESTVPYWLL